MEKQEFREHITLRSKGLSIVHEGVGLLCHYENTQAFEHYEDCLGSKTKFGQNCCHEREMKTSI